MQAFFSSFVLVGQSVVSEWRLDRRGNLRSEDLLGSKRSDKSHTRGGDGRKLGLCGISLSSWEWTSWE